MLKEGNLGGIGKTGKALKQAKYAAFWENRYGNCQFNLTNCKERSMFVHLIDHVLKELRNRLAC